MRLGFLGFIFPLRPNLTTQNQGALMKKSITERVVPGKYPIPPPLPLLWRNKALAWWHVRYYLVIGVAKVMRVRIAPIIVLTGLFPPDPEGLTRPTADDE